jgi:hypothetical protein
VDGTLNSFGFLLSSVLIVFSQRRLARHMLVVLVCMNDVVMETLQLKIVVFFLDSLVLHSRQSREQTVPAFNTTTGVSMIGRREE